MSIKVEDYLIKLKDEIKACRIFHDGSNLLFMEELRNRMLFPGFSKNQLEKTYRYKSRNIF